MTEVEPPYGKSTNTNRETGLKEGFTQEQWQNMKDEQGNPHSTLDMADMGFKDDEKEDR